MTMQTYFMSHVFRWSLNRQRMLKYASKLEQFEISTVNALRESIVWSWHKVELNEKSAIYTNKADKNCWMRLFSWHSDNTDTPDIAG